jgi:hypothetical protein
MFTKINFLVAAFVSTLAMSAFSADTQAGRYRVEGPNNSGGSDVQLGRYRGTNDNSGNFSIQYQSDSSMIGQSRMAGRYQQSQEAYATARVYESAPSTPSMMTQRGQNADVSAPRTTGK